MTKQEKSDVPNPPDPEAKFINFSEDFRRAKRASLSWSALAFFVAAAPNWDENARIFGVAIPYPQAGFALMLMLVAAFYFVSFRRSLSIVSYQNSIAAERANAYWDNITSVLSDLQKNLEPIESSAAEAELYAEVMKRGVEAEGSAIDHWISMVSSEMGNFNRDEFDALKESLSSPEPMLKTDYQFALQKVSEWVHDVEHRWATASGMARQTYADQQREALRKASDYSSHLPEIQLQIELLESSLHTFRNAIDNTAKRYHLWLDKIPAVALFVLACIATMNCIYLAWPETIRMTCVWVV
ncbi:hypothetical protein GRI34_08725 [Erythrobacter aquimaris]|uniref:Uncharacterized protein n=1 Tax=Qipengyuania aquimaris TaxID=255984 RepID=A0A6I4TKK2_9SPHN|nr:hypothetical protein [Qipengyuania aquimaris]MXO96495.1 hypothetical protein [Qipengyuania aquimaris]